METQKEKTLKELNHKLIMNNLGFIIGYFECGIKRYKLTIYKNMELKEFNNKEEVKKYVIGEVLKE